MQLAGLGIHEVGRERPGVPSEQGVRQRDVAPVEAPQVQPDEQNGERVDQPRRGVLTQRLREQGPIGQRELQVLGDQGRLQRLARRVSASTDDPDGLDGGQPQPPQQPQQAVLTLGEFEGDLLDRQNGPGHAHESHRVPRDSPGQRGEEVLRPGLQRNLPGQVEDRGVGLGGGDRQPAGVGDAHRPPLCPLPTGRVGASGPQPDRVRRVADPGPGVSGWTVRVIRGVVGLGRSHEWPGY